MSINSILHWILFIEIELITKKHIYSGPFKGLYYSGNKQRMGRNYFTRLLGTYEKEINEDIEDILKNDYELIVDIGAAEGYFVNGFASKTNAKCVAYEQDESLRDLIKVSAEKNNVSDKIELKGKLTFDDFSDELNKDFKKLIFLDVDGFENELLDLKKFPKLEHCDIFVETHDCYVDNITKDLIDRFKNTHTIKQSDEQERTLDDLPFKDFINRRLFKNIYKNFLDEGRPEPQSWLYMKANKLS